MYTIHPRRYFVTLFGLGKASGLSLFSLCTTLPWATGFLALQAVLTSNLFVPAFTCQTLVIIIDTNRKLSNIVGRIDYMPAGRIIRIIILTICYANWVDGVCLEGTAITCVRL